MPVKEINIIPMVQKILDKTMELMPRTTVNLGNMLLDKVHELWTLKAKNAPLRKDGSPSLWGERYANTLTVNHVTSKNQKGSVYADERSPDFMFVEMVENGVKEWSIKDALLAGKAARRNAGKYGNVFVHVPFRYRIPGKGKPTSSFAGIMPQNVYEVAKAGGIVGSEFGNYAGLRKFGEGVHSQYMTFRTVSKKSQGWKYPNKPATPVYEEVSKLVENMMEKTIINFITGYMKDMEKEGKRS